LRGLALLALVSGCHRTVAPNADAPPGDASLDGAPDAAILSWTAPELVETFSFGNAVLPSAAIDAAGDIVVAWIDDGGMNLPIGEVWANVYSATANEWGEARRISTNANGTFPRATIAPDGRAVVVWTESAPDDPLYAIAASRFATGFGWSPPELAGNIGGFRGTGPGNQLLPPPPPTVAANARGQILLAYPTRVGVTGVPPGANDTIINKYDPTTGWGTATTLLPQPAFLVAAAIDPDGLGVVAEIDNGSCKLVREVAGVGWATMPLSDIGDLACIDHLAVGRNNTTIMTAGDIPAAGSGLDFDVQTIDGTGATTVTLAPNVMPYGFPTLVAVGDDAATSLVLAAVQGTTKEWTPVAATTTPNTVMSQSFGAGSAALRADNTFAILLASNAPPDQGSVSRRDAAGTWHVDEAVVHGSCGPVPVPVIATAIADTDRAVAVWSAAPANGGLCDIHAIRLR
jgi:hypothetical protein